MVGITFFGVVSFTDFTLFSILIVLTEFFALAISLTGVFVFEALFKIDLTAGLAILFVEALGAGFGATLVTGLLITLDATLIATLVVALGVDFTTVFWAGFEAVLLTGLVMTFPAVLATVLETTTLALVLVSAFRVVFFGATFAGVAFFDNTFLEGVFLTGMVFGIFALDVKK
ncbi:hypothetical protein [Polynucleobacter rarus]|uniref:hypothetical protein n=1 Tax=Polynucleobacter rarus TaxID=556055 RepID=UPI001FE48E69|nr:hypothetical protein [Polynucleobacter rarus]